MKDLPYKLPERYRSDGRRKITALPQHVHKGTQPMSVTAAWCRKYCDMLFESRRTEHSGRGSTMWVLVEFCETNGFIYTIDTHYDPENAMSIWGYTFELL